MPQPRQQRSSLTSLLRNVDSFLEEHQRLSGQGQHQPTARPRRPADRTSEQHAASYQSLLLRPNEPHPRPDRTSNRSNTSNASNTSDSTNTSTSSRPSTIFFDWDGHSQPKVRHRHSSNESQRSGPNLNKDLPSLPSTSSSQVSLSAPKPAPLTIRRDLRAPFPGSQLDRGIHAPSRVPLLQPRRISSFDAETGFEWDYDGRIFHIHSEDPDSPHSDYFCFDGDVARLRTMEVEFTDEPGEAKGGTVREKIRRSREKVVRFISRIFGRLRGVEVGGRSVYGRT